MKTKVNILEKIENNNITMKELINELGGVTTTQSIIISSMNKKYTDDLDQYIINNIIKKKKKLELMQLYDNNKSYIVDIVQQNDFKKDDLLFLSRCGVIPKPVLFTALHCHLSEIEEYISKRGAERKFDIMEISEHINLTIEDMKYMNEHLSDAYIILMLDKSRSHWDFPYINYMPSWNSISEYIKNHPETLDNISCYLNDNDIYHMDMLKADITYFINISGIQYHLMADDIELLLKEELLPDISDIKNFEYHYRIINRYNNYNRGSYNDYISHWYCDRLLLLLKEDILTKHQVFCKKYLSSFVDLILTSYPDFIKKSDLIINDINIFLEEIFFNVYFENIFIIKKKIFNLMKNNKSFFDNIKKNFDSLNTSVKHLVIQYMLTEKKES